MKKIYTASWNLFTSTVEADRVFCQLVMFFTVFFHWMHKMKYSCYQQSSVIHGWFVYWIFGWEMRRLSKLEIRFRMTSFSLFTLLDTGWKVPQAILALLDSFQVSLCHREAGERGKERCAWDDGKGKEKKRGRHSFSLPIIHRALSMF